MTYSFTYDGSSRPKWEKVLTASNGEEFRVELHFDNQTDRNQLTAGEAFSYLELLLQYSKDVASTFELITIQESPSKEPIPVKSGYREFEWAIDTLSQWWSWAYYNDEFDATPEPTDEPA